LKRGVLLNIPFYWQMLKLQYIWKGEARDEHKAGAFKER
jgi:hypothetical protein